MAVVIPLRNQDVVEMRMYTDLFQQRVLNVFHYQAFVEAQQTSFQDAVDLFNAIQTGDSGVLTAIHAAYTPDARHVRTEYQIIKPTRYASIVKQGLNQGSLPITSGTAPANVAMVVTKKGIQAARGRTGSVHIAGFPNAYVAQGVVTNPATVLLADIGEAMLRDATLTGGTRLQPLIYSRRGLVLSQALGAYSIQTTSRVMRRRTVGVGV